MRDFDYIELKVPAKARYISVIRLTVSGIATAMGFKFDEIEDLKIATEEAVMKVVQQTAKETDGAELIIGCGAYADKIEIMVGDYGNSVSFNETKTKIETYSKDDENLDLQQEDALGLYLMETLMDEVKINNEGGVAVFMTKYVTREQVGDCVERITT
jgi:serine/threonine-protein kinase RsbW